MLRSRVFWQLFGAFSLVFVLALGGLVWLLLGRMEEHLRGEIRSSLTQKAVLVRELALARPRTQKGLQPLARDLGGELRARITFIDHDGTVLGESDEDPDRLEKHLNRPEVQEALQAGVGWATRYSTSVHFDMMYVALRVDDPSGPWFVRIALPLQSVEDEVAWLRGLTVSATAGALVVLLLVSLWLARRWSAPLVELADAARGIAGGEYGRAVTVSARGEVGDLAAAFNDMSRACADHIAQMEQDREQLRVILRSMIEGVLFIDAEQRVVFLNDAAGRLLGVSPESVAGKRLWEVVRHPQFLRAAADVVGGVATQQGELDWFLFEPRVFLLNAVPLAGPPPRGAVLVLHEITEQRRLEQTRTDFVANVSHELKTPLSAITAAAETLLDGAIDDAEHRGRFVQRIGENARRLHALVVDLLELGRIEAGREELEFEAVDLAAQAAECVTRHEPAAIAKRLTLICENTHEPVIARADAGAVERILANLVDNAVKYSTSGGSVTIRCEADGDRVLLHVCDTGVGIPAKDLARIFERFYRVDPARSRNVGGSGLGLAIVKHLTEKMAGEVSVRSQVGVGSEFTVRLPRAG